MPSITPTRSEPTSAAITALKHRAKTGILSAVLYAHSNLNFWQGYYKALHDLSKGTGQALADKDAASGHYEAPGVLRAASGCLDVDAYILPGGEIEDLLAKRGIKRPGHPVAAGYFVSTHQFEDGTVAAVDVHSEHAALVVDGKNDSSVLHVGSIGDAVIVAQGGAA